MYHNLYAVYGAPYSQGERVAANLAATFALEGLPTLFIAGDLTTSYAQRMFGINVPRERSLDAVWRAPLTQVAIPTGIRGLSLLAAQDTVTAVDYDYMDTSHSVRLLEEATRAFARVVVDCTRCGVKNYFAMHAIADGICVVPYQQETRALSWLLSYRPVLERLSADVRYICVQDSYEFSEAEFAEFSGVRPATRIRLGETRHRARPTAAGGSYAAIRLRRALLGIMDITADDYIPDDEGGDEDGIDETAQQS